MAKYSLIFLSFVLVLLTPTKLIAQEERESVSVLKQRLNQASQDDKVIGLLNDIAWEYVDENYDSSLYYAERALKLSEEKGDVYWKSVSLEMMAILMELSGRFEEAISLYLEVIPLRNQVGGEGLENTYNNMAALFQSQGNHDRSLEYFLKSLEIEKLNDNQSGIAACLINMGISYKNLGKLDTAGVFFKQAELLSEALQDTVLITHSSINLGWFYQESNMPDSSKIFFRKARSFASITNDLNTVGVAVQGLADIAQNSGDFQTAELLLEEAETCFAQVNSFSDLSKIYLAKANLFSKTNQHQLANAYFSKHLSLNDSLMNMEILRLTSEMEQKYQSERKERQITELELMAAEQELQVKTSRSNQILLLLFAVVLLLFAGFLAYRYRTQRRNSLLLGEKNKTIEMALQDKEVLLREIHHRVKNNLQVVSSLLSIQGREIEDPKALEAVTESQNRVKSMALIHQYLYGEHDLKSINMQEYVTQLSHNLFETYRLDRDLVELELEVELIHLDVDTAVPVGIILNELITNSLKYAFPEGSEGVLTVKLQEQNHKLVLTVSDNGVGDLGEKSSGTSFGMKLIQAFKRKLDAEIEFDKVNGFKVTCKIGKYKRIWLENIAS